MGGDGGDGVLHPRRKSERSNFYFEDMTQVVKQTVLVPAELHVHDPFTFRSPSRREVNTF